MFSTNQNKPKPRNTVILMHVFKLHHGEMNPKEHRETEHTMFWQFSVNAVSFQQLKT